jgi:hypothetical protein
MRTSATAKNKTSKKQPPEKQTTSWWTATAGLVMVGAAGAMMAYGAPAHAAGTGRGWGAQARAAARSHVGAVTVTAKTNSQEGTLVSATLLQQVSAKSVRTELAGARLAPGAPALGGGEARYGVDADRVTYRTADANGRPVVASGLVALPVGGTKGPAELFAPAGFAVTEPDYVGMGTGNGPIEYLIAKSEASASADLITAARTR